MEVIEWVNSENFSFSRFISRLIFRMLQNVTEGRKSLCWNTKWFGKVMDMKKAHLFDSICAISSVIWRWWLIKIWIIVGRNEVSYFAGTSTHGDDSSNFSSLEPSTQSDLFATSNTKNSVPSCISPHFVPSIQILMELNLAHMSLSQSNSMKNTRH